VGSIPIARFIHSRGWIGVTAVGEGGVLVLGKTFFEGRSSNAAVAQSVECVLGKDEVMGSNPISSFD
jgi:hypothetical protein